MKYLLLITVLLFTACSVNTKFITTETAIKTLEYEEESTNYNISEYKLLYADSLQSDFVFDLAKPYQNIEDIMNDLAKPYQNIKYLVNKPDKYLTEFLGTIKKSNIQIPILKHNNKVLVKGDFTEGSGVFTYILELIEPQKLVLKVVHFSQIFIHPTPQPQLLTQEDCINGFVPPEFDHGNDGLRTFIKQNTNYPESAKRDSIQGWVTISFWVEKDLTTSGYEIVESRSSISKNKTINKKVREDLYKEALRVAKLVTYTKPACKYGTPIRYQTGIVVYFKP